jgi:pimeloyl-ACP methyl ester carboxylesterase
MPFTTAADGCRLHFTDHGPQDAQAILLGYPWNDGMAEMSAVLAGGVVSADLLKALNRELIEGLAASYRVLAMDYPRGMAPTEGPRPDDLTAATVVADHLAVADAAGVDTFAVLGYSWSATTALQVATRSERCTGVVMGGWSPLSAPYAELRGVLDAMRRAEPDHAAAELWRQIANYYASIADWDEEGEVSALTGPRTCFYGALDNAVPGMEVPIADRARQRTKDLETLGWTVVEVPGADHGAAMAPGLIVELVEKTLGR